MPQHPPWLRFQAYFMGLPKTGSTSVATVFGRYRSAHEWQLKSVIPPAVARRRGLIDDEEFLRVTGDRITRPAFEMDSATFHYLYADLLVDRFPRAVFILPVRDVFSWADSLLDMILRKNMGRAMLGLDFSPWETEYITYVTRRRLDVIGDPLGDGREALAPLMRYWADHYQRMTAALPPNRTLVLRTRDIPARLAELAALAGVPPETLRADLAHANRTPMRFRRFGHLADDEVRTTYDRYCARLMAEQFPQEHAAWPSDQGAGPTWEEYRTHLWQWVSDAVAEHGERATR